MLERLQAFGLTTDEARLYLHLLEVKSSAVRELLKSPEFGGKWRSNLYKIVNGLIGKGFLVQEEKGGRNELFPVPPKEALQAVLDAKEHALDELRELVHSSGDALESIYAQPTIDLSVFPDTWQRFIESIAIPGWIIREKPRITSIHGLGTEYSVEFDTGHRFKPNTAGVVIHDFPYPEHKMEALPRIRDHLQASMAKALKSAESAGPIRMKNYKFEDNQFPGKLFGKPDDKPMPFVQLVTRWTLAGTFKGGFVTVNLEEFPAVAISLWGAATKDLIELLRKVMQNYKAQGNDSASLQGETEA